MLKIELYKQLYVRMWKLSNRMYNKYMDINNDDIPTLWETPRPDLWIKIIPPIMVHDLIEFALIYFPDLDKIQLKQDVIEAVNHSRIYRFMRHVMKFETTKSAKNAWNVFIKNNKVTIF